MKFSRWLLAIAAVSYVVAACSDDPTGAPTGAPRTGTLLLQLRTPHADDGAVLFEVTGAPIDSATAAGASLRLYTRQAGGTLVGVVVGAVADGPIVRLRVPDVSAAASYQARVLEVADRQNTLRTSLEDYVFTVTP